MTFYGFKPNPKQQVVDKAGRLFGREANVDVTGARQSPLDCKRMSLPTGSYYVECTVDGKLIATAHSKDWRKAYKLLVIEVEKAYEAALHNT
jgi:hypothetical protein